jgi:hypothetical protein
MLALQAGFCVQNCTHEITIIFFEAKHISLLLKDKLEQFLSLFVAGNFVHI